MARRVASTEEIVENLGESLKMADEIQPPPLSPQGASPTPHIGDSYNRTLDEAATLLINILSPSIRDYLIEVADIVLKIPRWQMILGSIMSQYESGTLTAPSIDPSWRQMEMLISDSVCQLKSCGKKFIPKRFGQRFCSQECGDENRKKEIEDWKYKMTGGERNFV